MGNFANAINNHSAEPAPAFPTGAVLFSDQMEYHSGMLRRATHQLQLVLMAAMLTTTLAVVSGCGTSETQTLLANSSSSAEEACQRVLDALAMSDTTTMHSLRITRFEHDSVLVPNMPIGNADPATTDIGYAWFLLDQNNVKGIRRAIDDYGGQQFRVAGIRFTKPAQQHGPVTLHKGTEVTVTDTAGTELVLPIFGSIIEHGHRFKVVSIRD